MNEPLISWTQHWTFLDRFCHHFWVGLLLLCCCTHPKVMTKMAKKCSTDQRFIRKRNTTYKIHTLVVSTRQLFVAKPDILSPFSEVIKKRSLTYPHFSIEVKFSISLCKSSCLLPLCVVWPKVGLQNRWHAQSLCTLLSCQGSFSIPTQNIK